MYNIKLYKAMYAEATEVGNYLAHVEDQYTNISFTHYNHNTLRMSNDYIEKAISWANVELQFFSFYTALLLDYKEAIEALDEAEAKAIKKAILHNMPKVSLANFDVYMQNRLKYVLSKCIVLIASYNQYLAKYYDVEAVGIKYKHIEYSVYNPMITFNQLLQIYTLLDFGYNDNAVVKNELKA